MTAREGGHLSNDFLSSEGPTCGCKKKARRKAPCFRPVLYRELCNYSAWADMRIEISGNDFPAVSPAHRSHMSLSQGRVEKPHAETAPAFHSRGLLFNFDWAYCSRAPSRRRRRSRSP